MKYMPLLLRESKTVSLCSRSWGTEQVAGQGYQLVRLRERGKASVPPVKRDMNCEVL